jgi:hypothetical protein
MVVIPATSYKYTSVLIISKKKGSTWRGKWRRKWRRERGLKKKWVMEDEGKKMINSISGGKNA